MLDKTRTGGVGRYILHRMSSRATLPRSIALPATRPIDPAVGGVLSVDLGAIRRNYRALAARVAPAVCGAVVKADGYGLGAAQVVRALLAEGCQHFYVAHLS